MLRVQGDIFRSLIRFSGTRMASTITVRPLPPCSPDPSTTKAHHVGSPPKSFQNPWPSFKDNTGGLGSLLKSRFGSHPEKNFVPVPEGPNGSRSNELVEIRKPDWAATKWDRLRATWIGHASFLVETPAQGGNERGIRILFDPVFSDRTSPLSWLGPKRYTPTPCTLDEVPDVDVVCISHNHYDHLDIATIQHLYSKLKGTIHFLVGLGIKGWFTQHVGCDPLEVTELDWWEQCELQVDGVGSIKLTCCPTQHFSGRSIWDMGHTLWCSWAVEGGSKKLFFAGDTAYQAQDTPSHCPVFKQIGDTLGPFDLATLPIGLCTPQSLMGHVHATPEQSLEMHKELKSKLSIGMHYGTVRGGLSSQYEKVQDPPKRWREAAEKEGLWNGGGVEGNGEAVDTTRSGVGLCLVGETVAV